MSIYRGKLIRWNDEKGYGFIENNTEKNGVFLHISELIKMSRRPIVNDIILYELSIENKKIRAVNAVIEGVQTIRERSKLKNKRNENIAATSKSKPLLITILIILGLVMIYSSRSIFHTPSSQNIVNNQEINNTTPITENLITQDTTSRIKFTCDGRTKCSQMRSKEEAVFFINNCPNTEMDGDHDGDPCENQFGRN